MRHVVSLVTLSIPAWSHQPLNFGRSFPGVLVNGLTPLWDLGVLVVSMDAASCDIQLKFALLMLRCESKLGEEIIRHRAAGRREGGQTGDTLRIGVTVDV